MVIGDKVIIARGDFDQEATVYWVGPLGSFSVEWYAGHNPFAPWLPGHYCTQFDPDCVQRDPESAWRFVRMKEAVSQ